MKEDIEQVGGAKCVPKDRSQDRVGGALDLRAQSTGLGGLHRFLTSLALPYPARDSLAKRIQSADATTKRSEGHKPRGLKSRPSGSKGRGRNQAGCTNVYCADAFNLKISRNERRELPIHSCSDMYVYGYVLKHLGRPREADEAQRLGDETSK
jgi:hypothetical protein